MPAHRATEGVAVPESIQGDDEPAAASVQGHVHTRVVQLNALVQVKV